MREIKKTLKPKIHSTAFVAPGAHVMGEVELKEHSSIWPGAVLRGDINRISVGRYSNIQDLSVMHVDDDLACTVGDYVVGGHQITLHGSKIGNGVLIGIGAIILNGSVIGDECLIGAGSLVTEGMKLKKGGLYFGRPAKFIRKLKATEIKATIAWAKKYARLAEIHQQGLIREAF